MNLPAASCRVSKDFLPVTARSVATRQSHCKRLLRFARNDQTVTLQQAAGNYQVKDLISSKTSVNPIARYKYPRFAQSMPLLKNIYPSTVWHS
jgi:hypothetical protein